MRKPVIYLALALLFAAATALPAGADSYGTELPFVLGSGARASGMGLASTSLNGQPSVQYFNPALLSEMQSKQIEFFRTVLFDSKSLYHTVNYTHPTVNYGTFGLSILRLDIGGIEQRDIHNQLLSDDMKNSQTRVLLGYARQLHSNLSAGFNLKIDNQTFGGTSGSGIGLDVGFLSVRQLNRAGFLKELRAGLALQNMIEPTVKLNQEGVADPMQVVLGLSAMSGRDQVNLATSLDLVNPRFSPFMFRVGQEVTFYQTFSLRAGLDDATPTFGFGARYDRFAVDYAYRDEDLGSNHKLSLSVSFGASVEELKIKARRDLEQHINSEINRKMDNIEQTQIAGMISKADSLFALDQYEPAIESYDAVQYWAPDNEHVKTQLLKARYRLAFQSGLDSMNKEDYLQAIYYFKQALVRQPADSETEALITQCQNKLAESQNRAVLVDQLLAKTIDLYANKSYLDALLGFDEILKIDPGNSLAGEYRQKTLVNIDNARQRLILRSRSLAGKNDYAGAIKALEEALLYKPDDSMLLAEIDILQNKRAAAQAAAAKKSLAAAPVILKSSTPALSEADRELLESKYQKGMEHFDKGNFDRATRSFLEIWTIDPEFHNVTTFLTKAYLLMGMQHYSQEQYEEAMDIWEKALKIDPQNIKAKRFLMKTRTEIEKLGGVTNE